MSDLVRIGLVSEGITDYVVIHGSVRSILGDRTYDLKLLQRESSAFHARHFGGGWKGVSGWCGLVCQRNGGLAEDIVLDTYDILILHLDADVADENEPSKRLPCAVPCPPASATTDALRAVFLSWLNETTLPERTVFCTPSKSTEAWVVEALFPQDSQWKKKRECLPKPETRLGQQPLSARLQKREADYWKHAPRFSTEWPRVAKTLSEAGRFDREFRKLLP